MSVYMKLQKARCMLQAMPLKKSGHNKFAGYSYFELGDFLPQIQTIFFELGLCGIVSFGEKLATLAIFDVDSKDAILITSPMAEANLKGCHPIQNLGAVETYTRRYLWVSAMEIVEHDALDSSEPVKEVKEVKKPTSVAASEFNSLDNESQAYLKEVAMQIVEKQTDLAIFEKYTYFKGQLDSEEQIALWSLLDSKTRTMIKKVGSSIKEEK